MNQLKNPSLAVSPNAATMLGLWLHNGTSMKNIGFTAWVSIMLLSGCIYSEGALELKGKVLDENTNAAISNREIIIQALAESDDTYISTYAGSFLTDSSGGFNYTLKKVKNAFLYDFCIVGDTAYAFQNNRLGLTELNRNGMFLSFYLNKLADLTIKINRISKTPSCDTLYVSWESNGIDGAALYPYEIEDYWINSNEKLMWVGGDIKSAIKTKVFAGKKTVVRWELFRYGKYKEIIDTISCIRDAANTVYFNY
jgi:hypothetical protein